MQRIGADVRKPGERLYFAVGAVAGGLPDVVLAIDENATYEDARRLLVEAAERRGTVLANWYVTSS